MKKALIIFTISITLVIVGTIMTISEISTWGDNYNETNYAESELYLKKLELDINEYEQITFVDNLGFLDDLFIIEELKYNVDAKQEVNKLTLQLTYYSKLGECDLKFNDFYASDYLEIYPQCGISQWSTFDVLRFLNSEDFKSMMKNKQIPLKFKELQININPNDQDKIINSR